jgi:flavin reductase (DIM6/NTAB) family NADH-FMN oxidoreductase RutF
VPVVAVSGADKFLGVEWRPARHTGAPLIASALAWLDCVLKDVHEGAITTMSSRALCRRRPVPGTR